jgi:endo-1,4-beta-D-glucanase Y
MTEPQNIPSKKIANYPGIGISRLRSVFVSGEGPILENSNHLYVGTSEGASLGMSSRRLGIETSKEKC